jgi:hypothetical protein
MKIGKPTDRERRQAEQAAEAYYKAKKNKPTEAVLGFIKKNVIVGLTTPEIDALVSQAGKVMDRIDPATGQTIPGELIGEGDKFKTWCEKLGREVPNDDIVRFMNGNPYEIKNELLNGIPDTLALWKSYCSYLAGRGR